MEAARTIVIIGPTRPLYSVRALTVTTLLACRLIKKYRVIHFDSGASGEPRLVVGREPSGEALNASQAIRLLCLLVRTRPELVYLAVSETSAGYVWDSVCILLARWVGATVVIHLQGAHFRSWYEHAGKLAQAYARLVLSNVARVIVPTESLEVLFRDLVPLKTVATVPNGIAWEREQPKPGVGMERSRHRILFLSHHDRSNGAFVQLAALRLLVNVRQDVECVFAGPWPQGADRREADAFVQQHGLQRHVIFTDQLQGEDKLKLLESTDLFVLHSPSPEGHTPDVLEAMAAGLPIVFANCSALRDVVADWENGFEVKSNDPESLANRLLWCLAHPQVMKEMGEKSRRRYESYYTREHFETNMIRIFSQLARSDEAGGVVIPISRAVKGWGSGPRRLAATTKSDERSG